MSEVSRAVNAEYLTDDGPGDEESVAYAYLDWAATTPLCEEAADAMIPYLVAGPVNIAFGANANSLHTPGRTAFNALEEARSDIAHSLKATRPDEIIFTSGSTEADNAALFGLVKAAMAQARQKGKQDFRPHVITTYIEHDAILSAIPALREMGCEVTLLAPDRAGFVSVDGLAAAMRENTVLVSVMMANNEVGAIEPIAELAQVAHAGKALFHTDATQALGKVPIDLGALGVDAASFSAHKICGPKGAGALYLRARTPFEPMILGGGQENGLRSGTQNVCGSAGFAAACEWACEHREEEAQRLRTMRDYLYEELCSVKGVKPTVEVKQGSTAYLPSIVNVLVPGFESETLILRLDIAGFAVSGGSACSSHSLDPSHVLMALGVPKDEALCSLRISMGRFTTSDEVERFVTAFKDAIGRS